MAASFAAASCPPRAATLAAIAAVRCSWVDPWGDAAAARMASVPLCVAVCRSPVAAGVARAASVAFPSGLRSFGGGCKIWFAWARRSVACAVCAAASSWLPIFSCAAAAVSWFVAATRSALAVPTRCWEPGTNANFTTEETAAIHKALRATWKAIEVEACCGDLMHRDDVVDVVLDLDYAKSHFEDQELYGRFVALAMWLRVGIAKETFPLDEVYGGGRLDHRSAGFGFPD